MTTIPTARASALDAEMIEHLMVLLVSNLDTTPLPTSPDEPEPMPEVMAVGLLPPETDGLGLAINHLGGCDPIAGLIGFEAPDDWQAMGIVATGRWFELSDGEAASGSIGRRTPRTPGGRVRMANVVTRAGEVLSVISRDGDEPSATWLPRDGHYGRADDAVRRALGLPTAKPCRDIRELWALVWCDVITERVLSDSVPSWTEVACAHPAIGQLGLVDADAKAWAVDNLVRLGNEFAELHSWADLRELCARNEWIVSGVEAQDAAWMDEGMFSRWALESYPELNDLLDDLAVLLSTDAAYRVWRTVDAWGLP